VVQKEKFPITKQRRPSTDSGEPKFFKARCEQWILANTTILLITFIKPFGLYSFNRLPFGISSTPEYFQKRMQMILTGFEGVLCHMNDIPVYGTFQEEHDGRQEAV
jgi:hypothetical protein